MSDAELNKLRWHCRRGMRELDQLLGWYLSQRYPHVDEVKKVAFRELLDQQDPQLWDWLVGRSIPAQDHFRGIVDEIRARDLV